MTREQAEAKAAEIFPDVLVGTKVRGTQIMRERIAKAIMEAYEEGCEEFAPSPVFSHRPSEDM